MLRAWAAEVVATEGARAATSSGQTLMRAARRDAEYLARVAADCSRENVEATINTTYLQDLFGADAEGADESVWTALGELLRDCWKARVEALFPDREFAATFRLVLRWWRPWSNALPDQAPV